MYSHFVALLVFLTGVLPSVGEPEPVQVLLVTSPELEEAWMPFAEWKTAGGKSTRILSTDEIGKTYEGPDLQEKIRRCVREHIDKAGTRWVILGGDSLPGGGGVVPDRDTLHETRWGKNTDIPTDIFYISPTNWDADGDGIHGEFVDDRDAITYPDGSIGLGRIPLRSVEDVEAYTAKVMSYESSYPEGGYGNSMVYTCTVAGAYPKVRRSWDEHVSKVFPEGRMSRFFSNQTPWDESEPGDHDLSVAHLIELINEKSTGKFHLHGHGLIGGWVLEEEEFFSAKHVSRLTNRDAYPMITTVSCFTGQFDAAEDPCISESMLRAPNAGAIAIVAPCREGKPHFMKPKEDIPLMLKEGKMDGTTTTMTLFWEKGIGESLTAGEALMKSKAALADKAERSAMFHLCLAELNLLGDPTLAVHPMAVGERDAP